MKEITGWRNHQLEIGQTASSFRKCLWQLYVLVAGGALSGKAECKLNVPYNKSLAAVCNVN